MRATTFKATMISVIAILGLSASSADAAWKTLSKDRARGRVVRVTDLGCHLVKGCVDADVVPQQDCARRSSKIVDCDFMVNATDRKACRATMRVRLHGGHLSVAYRGKADCDAALFKEFRKGQR